jgi:hypothetical protein
MIFFIGKISKLGHDMPTTNSEHPYITDQIISGKHHSYEFCTVSMEEVNSFVVVYQQWQTTWI